MFRYGPATALTVVLSLAINSPGASVEGLGFKVAFSNCEEFIGEGPVALAPAQRLVPQGYAIAAASP